MSTTLQDLQSGTGQAVTAGGTLLPMPDVIRLASHAHHYLVIFDHHTHEPLYLGRSKRIASVGQRIVLHAKDRGCTFPGCTVPGYGCQVHHAQADWANGGLSNIDEEALACGPHNRLVEEGGWRTRKRKTAAPNGSAAALGQRPSPGERLPPSRELPTPEHDDDPTAD